MAKWTDISRRIRNQLHIKYALQKDIFCLLDELKYLRKQERECDRTVKHLYEICEDKKNDIQ